MKIDTKFSKNDIAYVAIDPNTIIKVKIKSIEIKVLVDTETKYISDTGKEFLEKDLLSKREVTELL